MIHPASPLGDLEALLLAAAKVVIDAPV